MYAKKSSLGPLLKDAPKSNEVECKICYGPHDVLAYKWMSGACFSCGKLGHKSSMPQSDVEADLLLPLQVERSPTILVQGKKWWEEWEQWT